MHRICQNIALTFWAFSLFTSCSGQRSSCPETPALSSIHLIDREGMMESVAAPERLKNYEEVDFLSSQPYQKVLRIYARDAEGNMHAYVTTYHPNGQVKQYLEVLNNRAFGKYREWFANGAQKVEAQIIEGTADISPAAEKTWLFDGECLAWDDAERLLVSISYEKGSLEGTSFYYHSNGNLWKEIPYEHNAITGTMLVYLENGELLQSTEYAGGVKEGHARRYWNNEQLAADEVYVKGQLMTAGYYNADGKQIAEIQQGSGFRALFGKDYLSELQEYRHGALDGEVKVFDPKGRLIQIYHMKNGLKNGEEIHYYIALNGQGMRPKLSIIWSKGKVQGIVKTWYDNGVMESQKEMSENMKNGVATAWYRDGHLMMIEEYDQDKLKKGDYFRKGEKQSVSQVLNGDGVVTFFDADGHYLRKVNYHNGKPEE